tara:strand:+ start:369 stop:629 length:261 start_codon:yes stop_codon:yes gene_type:complete
MLITKIKLDTLLDEMTTKKAKRAVSLWAINQGQVTMDTLNALDEVSNSSLAILANEIEQELKKRGIYGPMPVSLLSTAAGSSDYTQ